MPRDRIPTENETMEPDDLEPEPTARPTARPRGDLVGEDDEKLVPMSNVGGAAPTPLGLDSGGNLPGSEDDLANLSEPEPPEPPEVAAVNVTRRDPGAGD
jgi:hypothetical protein